MYKDRDPLSPVSYFPQDVAQSLPHTGPMNMWWMTEKFKSGFGCHKQMFVLHSPQQKELKENARNESNLAWFLDISFIL